MMRSTRHQCPAPDCKTMVAREKLMCPTHSHMLSDALLRRLYVAYRNRHRGGTYEGEHRNACRAAIEHVRAQIVAQRERDAQGGLDL